MALTVHLVRHGETLFNHRRVVQGWVDSPLTGTGVDHARRAAIALGGRSIAGVHASTSGRAEQTAGVIAAEHPGVPVVRSAALRELHFGEWEGRDIAAFEQAVDTRRFVTELFTGTFAGFPDGESGPAFQARVQGAWADLLAAHPDGGEIAVVSHGLTIAMLLVTHGWETPGPLLNGSISVIRVGGAGPGSATAGVVLGAGLPDLTSVPL